MTDVEKYGLRTTDNNGMNNKGQLGLFVNELQCTLTSSYFSLCQEYKNIYRSLIGTVQLSDKEKTFMVTWNNQT